jgi:UDP-N-acetylmuramyl pentapeptide synthase
LPLSIGEIVSLARTPLGRRRVASSALPRLAPLLRQAAWLHRRTLARKVRVVAVTGSFGKSTTLRLTAAALGLPVPAADLEIPNGLWLVPQRVLRLAPGERRAVIEIGLDRPGQMARQARAVAPDVAVVTAVGGRRRAPGDDGRPRHTIQREKSRLLAGGPCSTATIRGSAPWRPWRRVRR